VICLGLATATGLGRLRSAALCRPRPAEAAESVVPCQLQAFSDVIAGARADPAACALIPWLWAPSIMPCHRSIPPRDPISGDPGAARFGEANLASSAGFAVDVGLIFLFWSSLLKQRSRFSRRRRSRPQLRPTSEMAALA